MVGLTVLAMLNVLSVLVFLKALRDFEKGNKQIRNDLLSVESRLTSASDALDQKIQKLEWQINAIQDEISIATSKVTSTHDKLLSTESLLLDSVETAQVSIKQTEANLKKEIDLLYEQNTNSEAMVADIMDNTALTVALLEKSMKTKTPKKKGVGRA